MKFYIVNFGNSSRCVNKLFLCETFFTNISSESITHKTNCEENDKSLLHVVPQNILYKSFDCGTN